MFCRSVPAAAMNLGIALAFILGIQPTSRGQSANTPQGTSQATINPVISFSKDEKWLAVRYGKYDVKIPRPVISPWKYKAQGKVYWVDPNGDDQGEGTENSPFRTASKAVAICKPGDLVYINPGDYVEAITIRRYGLPGRPIVISCAPGALGKVRIKLPKRNGLSGDGVDSSNTSVVAIKKADHIWINGLVLEGCLGQPWAPAQSAAGNPNGIMWENGPCVGCRATNNVCFNNLHCGLKDQSGQTVDLFLQGNICFHNGRSGLDHGIYMPGNGATIDGNILFDNTGWGVHCYEKPTNLSVTRNVCFYDNYGGIVTGGRNCQISNNVTYGGIYGIMFNQTSVANTVKNNIAFRSQYLDIFFGHDGAETFDYNSFVKMTNTSSPTKPGPHCIRSDPLFTAPEKGDFTLRKNSPCLHAGTPVPVSKPGVVPNIGAY
jgi:hypothetical protein